MMLKQKSLKFFLVCFLPLCHAVQSDHYSGTEDNCQFTVSISKRKISQCERGLLPAGDSTVNQICTQYLSITSNQQVQLEALSRAVRVLEEKLNSTRDAEEQEEGRQSGLGTNYVRWGRTECPPTATLVYEGVAGKSFYNHAGGGGNYLCLPVEPEWPDGATGGFESQNYIYGVEYQQTLNSAITQHDAPCAICQVFGRGQKIMIPAKKTCPQGWTKEYSGLLVSEKSTHTKASYECLDDNPEVRLGGAADTNGGLFYVVEADCGYSLPCPPYVEGYELACVVCTL